jgi:hypothetical protein
VRDLLNALDSIQEHLDVKKKKRKKKLKKMGATRIRTRDLWVKKNKRFHSATAICV